MPVYYSGKKFHYRFRVKGKRHYGICEGCTTEEQALAYEAQVNARLREEVKAAQEKLRQEEQKIAFNNNVRSLVENYRQVLNDGKKVSLADAYALYSRKPSRKRKCSDKTRKQKESYWLDFLAYMRETFPEIIDLDKVSKAHCEDYVTFLIDCGRFLKEKKVSLKTHGKVVPVSYEQPFLIGNKTIKEICSVIKSVFERLKDDAGLLANPWNDVILPAVDDSIEREIFSLHELNLIRNGLAKNHFCAPLFTVAAVTGLREGDICTLKWKEIDWTSGVIRRIMRKTGKGVTIPILSSLKVFLAGQPRVSEYVFPEHAELYRRCSSKVSVRIKDFLENELDIRTTVQPENRKNISIKDLHSMRHVFCYYAGKAGIPINIVQSIVGHMSPVMTSYYQNHVVLEDQKQELEKLPSFLIFNSANLDQEEQRKRQELIRLVQEIPVEKLQEFMSIAQKFAMRDQEETVNETALHKAS